MRIQRSWGLCVLTIIAVVIGLHEAQAQSYPSPGSAPIAAGYPGPAPQMPPAGYALAPQYAAVPPMGYGAPAGPMMGGQDMRVPAGPIGPYGMQPAAYYDPTQGAPQPLGAEAGMPMGDMSMGEYGMMDEGGPCQFCGGSGCEVCASSDFDMRLLRWLLPYGAGGCGAQRWYDVYVDWVTLKRDQVGTDVVFATDGIDGVDVLNTNQLAFSNESGFRVNFAIQLSAGNVLETSYLGSAHWSSQAEVVSPTNDLFSIYSDFGLNPPPFGFAETDRSALQRINYSSGFDSIELNYRQRWVTPNARIQGSWLAGVRYFYLKEDFLYTTSSPLNSAAQRSLVSAMNSMTGAQLGGDMWICIMPGLNVGAEGKIGLYGNHASQRTHIDAYTWTIANGLFPSTLPYEEKITEDSPAFIGDLDITLLWRIDQHWTFRTGYLFMWLDEVALASNNFNSEVPLAGFGTPREAQILNSDNVLYHGFHAGLEYLW